MSYRIMPHYFPLVVALVTSGCGGAETQLGMTRVVFLEGFTFDEIAGSFFAGDRVSHDAYVTREYIPGALPNVEQFRGYAGHMVRYLGPKNPSTNKCMDRSAATIEISPAVVLQDGASAIDMTPGGKLVEEFVTHGMSASAGILQFFSGEVSESTSVQLLVQDVGHQDVEGVIDSDKLMTLAQATPPADECDRRYIHTAVLTEVVSKKYRSVGKKASGQGFNIKVGAKFHNSQMEFSRSLYVYVETRGFN